MMFNKTILVPGLFEPHVAYLDVETRKVPTPDGYYMPNGERLRQRWSVVAVGIARNGWITLAGSNHEINVLNRASEIVHGATEIRYGATRKFDEMILKGRFTNARRAHLPFPVWPSMPYASAHQWVNVGSHPSRYERSDIPSREVPDYWDRGEWELVYEHLLRDVAELIIESGFPDQECERWCERIITEKGMAGEVCDV